MGEVELAEIQRRFHEFTDSMWNPYDLQVSGSICHYTSYSAFESMVRSGVFWLSDLETLIDNSEFRYCLGVLRPVVLMKEVPNEVKEKFLDDDPFGFGTGWFGYITSFCRATNKSEQWRDYADKGRGVAISFDYRDIRDGAETPPYSIFRILYDRAEQSRRVERLIDYAIQLGRDIGIRKSEHLLFWFEVMLILFHCAVRFKAPKFAGEEEVRILCVAPDRTGAKTRNHGDGGFRRYLEAPIPLTAVRGVTLGPLSEVPESQVLALLTEKGWSVPVTRSAIPLR